MRFQALLLTALIGAPAAMAQDPPRVVCRACDSHGEKDCPRHTKAELELERQVVHCSVAAACPKCGGALTVDCKICRNEAVEAAAAARRQSAAEWLDARRAEVDEHVASDTVVHVSTAHLDLAFDVRPLTVGRLKLDTHRLAHLYAERIEDLRRQFLELFGVGDADFSARLQVYMFRDRRDHALMAPRVAGGGANANAMKQMGIVAVYCMVHDMRAMPDDEGLWRNVVHNVTHLILSNMQPEYWLGNRKHGWVDEGTAHWFEDRLTGRCMNYCYEEVGVTAGATFKGGRWRVPVRRMAEAGELEPFAVVSSLNTDQLTGPQHALAFAYVDFLMTRYGGVKFADMVRRMKKGEPTRDAVQAAFGLGMLEFDGAFTDWVRETYPLEERG